MQNEDNLGLGFGVEHIVVLMFENRSFDNILGGLYPYHQQIGSYQFEGIPPGAENSDKNGIRYGAWTEYPPYKNASANPTMPDPDPGERFQNVNYQLYGHGFDPSTPYSQLGEPPMTGFVMDYVLDGPTKWIGDTWPKWPKLPRDGGKANPTHMMHYFSTGLTPVFSALAKQYAVCDHYFASVASQTFPNRMFAHAASSDGGVDDVEILEKHIFEGYKLNNVFQMLDILLGIGEAPNWRIYYDEAHESYSISKLLFNYVKKNEKTHLACLSNFASDVEAGLPKYTFIEPNYGHEISKSGADLINSYHPPFNVLKGEEFLWDIYNTLKTKNPAAWAKTLFLVTFDEHGGCYDHVPPPGVPAPIGGTVPPAPFDRYGVRVPTLVISPNVPPGTIYRATSANGQVLDHTSIIRTVFDCFLGPDVSINERDKNAPGFAGAMTSSAINPGVLHEPEFPDIPPPDFSGKDIDNHLSDMAVMASKGSET